MKILMMSKQGNGLGVAHRLVQENHSVDVWIGEEKYRDAGRGLVDRPESWRPLIPKADLIVCDMVGFGLYEDVFAKLAKPVLCCSKMADVMELDRKRGMEIMKRFDIDLPVTHSYKSPEEAKAVISAWQNPAGYVVKPSGNLNTGLTMLCESPEIFEWALSLFDKNQELTVQEIITDAVEVSTEGWFNGSEWISPINHTFEEKRFMHGGAGPMVGCMGNVVMAAKNPTRLAEATVMKLTPLLIKIGYKGHIDINALVTKERVNGLELTCRFGYDAVEALIEGMREPIGRFLFEVATGIKKEMDITFDYMMAVRVSRPPYPSDLMKDDKSEKGLPIVGYSDKNAKHVFLTDCMMVGDKVQYAATDGVICKVTAIGRTVDEAQNRVYRTIDNLKIPDAQFRTDIGDRVSSDLKRLIDWGWM